MFSYPRLVGAVFQLCVLLPLFGQPNDVLDTFAAENRRLEAQDPSTQTLPIPPEYDVLSEIEHLTEADFARMEPDSRALRVAWVNLIRDLPGGFPQRLLRSDPAVKEGGFRAAAHLDLIRRGDAATPILLTLAQELAETPFESSLLGIIDTLQSVQLEPFLEYSRNLLRTRTKSSQIVIAAGLLGRHGTDQDLLLLEQVAAARPYFAQTIRKEAKALKAHLEGEGARAGSPATKLNAPPSVQTQTPKKSPEAKPAPPTPSEEPTSSTPWSIIVVLIVAAIGLLWLLVKNRK
jgi:hypothetical protein